MFTPDSVYRNQEVRLGTVVQSDPATNTLILKDDKFNALMQVSLHLHDDVAVFPAVGEKWMVNRRGGTDWLLGKRMDTPTEPLPFSGLASGDRRLSTTGKIYLIASEVVISGTLVSQTLSDELSQLTTRFNQQINVVNETISGTTTDSNNIKFGTNSGSSLTVKTTGNTSFTSSGTLSLTAHDELDLTTTLDESGIVIVNNGSDGSITLQASDINLNGNYPSVSTAHGVHLATSSNGQISLNPGGGTILLTTTGSVGIGSAGSRVGFMGATAITRPAITGSRGGNAALASLLTALANQGLITDSTTA